MIVAIVIRNTSKRFSTSPTRAIAPIVNRPLPNTIAFGGVATGSMNEQVAAKAVGMPSMSGLIFIITVRDETTGSSIAAVPVLLISSVSKMTNVVTSTMTQSSGHVATPLNMVANQVASPDSCIAAASESPPVSYTHLTLPTSDLV